MGGDGLWILVLEGVLALGLLAFIVWWTLPSAPRPPGSTQADTDPGQTDAAQVQNQSRGGASSGPGTTP